MRTTIVAAVLAAAFALAGLPASSSAAPVASLATKTVVYGFGGRCPPTGWTRPAVRPAKAQFSASCELGARRIRWTDWKRTSAFAHAVIVFSAGFTTKRPGTLALSTVRRHDGHPYFARLVLRWTTKNGAHHKLVMTWKRLKGLGWLWA